MSSKPTLTLTSLLVAAVIAPAATAGAAPGARDTSFNRSGLAFAGLSRAVRDDVVRDAVGVAVARQSGGRLVLAATLRRWTRAARLASTSVALVRFTAAGRVDRTFGRRGVVITDLAGGSELPTAIVRDPSNRLVVAGGAHGRMLVLRYKPGGRLDRSFGDRGAALIRFPGGSAVANGVVLRPNGRIVVAGAAAGRAALAQLTARGRLDRSFSGDGRLTFDLGPGKDRLSGVALGGGVIFASGTAGRSAVLARLPARGTRRVTAVPQGTGHAIALDSQRRPLIAGGNLQGARGSVGGRPRNNGLLVARFQTNGDLDGTFAAGGVSRLPEAQADATGIAIDSTGRSLVSGPSGVSTCAFVGRLTISGQLDPTFGPGPGTDAPACGIAGTPPISQVYEISVRGGDGGESDYAGVLIQPNHRIVAVGSMGGDEPGQGDEPALARYLPT